MSEPGSRYRPSGIAVAMNMVISCACLLVSSPIAAQQVEQRVLGCYDVDVGRWEPPELTGDSIYFMPPTRMRLTMDTTSRVPYRVGGRVVEAAPGAMPSLHSTGRWDILGADSLAIVWGNGFAGVNVRFAIADTLRGMATTGTDVVGAQRHTAEVLAMPVACDAPVPESRRIRYRYSPVVRLESGDSIVLEQPVDSALIERRPSARSAFLRAAPLAPYAGADQVEISLREDGTIRDIRLHFGSDVDWGVLVSTLTSEYGLPTSGPHETPVRMAIWSSRLLSISIMGGRGGREGGPMVSLRSHRRE